MPCRRHQGFWLAHKNTECWEERMQLLARSFRCVYKDNMEHWQYCSADSLVVWTGLEVLLLTDPTTWILELSHPPYTHQSSLPVLTPPQPKAWSLLYCYNKDMRGAYLTNKWHLFWLMALEAITVRLSSRICWGYQNTATGITEWELVQEQKSPGMLGTNVVPWNQTHSWEAGINHFSRSSVT